MVGGTGFYLRWFIFGKAQTPPSNPETAARAQQLIAQAWAQAATAAGAVQQQQQQQPVEAVAPCLPQVGQAHTQPAAAAAAVLSEDQRWDAAVDVVTQLGDPETAARIKTERNNWYRLQRVLQVSMIRTSCHGMLPALC